jgi:hypothetical protein
VAKIFHFLATFQVHPRPFLISHELAAGETKWTTAEMTGFIAWNILRLENLLHSNRQNHQQ